MQFTLLWPLLLLNIHITEDTKLELMLIYKYTFIQKMLQKFRIKRLHTIFSTGLFATFNAKSYSGC